MPSGYNKRVKDESEESEARDSEGEVVIKPAKKTKLEVNAGPKSKAKVDSDSEDEDNENGDVEVLKDEDGGSYIELSRTRRVTVRDFKGSTLVDIREYYEDKKTEKLLPGKKGISLSVEQWQDLVKAMPTVVGLVDEAKKTGGGSGKKEKEKEG